MCASSTDGGGSGIWLSELDWVGLSRHWSCLRFHSLIYWNMRHFGRKESRASPCCMVHVQASDTNYFHCCVIFRGGQFSSPDPACDICHLHAGRCKQLNLEVAAHSAAGGVTWHELLHSLWPGSHKGWKEFIEMVMPLIYFVIAENV